MLIERLNCTLSHAYCTPRGARPRQHATNSRGKGRQCLGGKAHVCNFIKMLKVLIWNVPYTILKPWKTHGNGSPSPIDSRQEPKSHSHFCMAKVSFDNCVSNTLLFFLWVAHLNFFEGQHFFFSTSWTPNPIYTRRIIKYTSYRCVLIKYPYH